MNFPTVNINCTDLINQTNFQRVSTLSTQPYYLDGFIILFAILILFTFFSGFMKVTPKGNKTGWESWTHNKFWIFIIIALIFAIIWFFAPYHFSLGG